LTWWKQAKTAHAKILARLEVHQEINHTHISLIHVKMKTDGMNPVPSAAVYRFIPYVFVFPGKYGNGTENGTECIGTGTENG
jgi:hypothetical protein